MCAKKKEKRKKKIWKRKPKMAFPSFYGRENENASNFLDNLEMAFLVSGRDEDAVKLKAFPLVLREEAKS